MVIDIDSNDTQPLGIQPLLCSRLSNIVAAWKMSPRNELYTFYLKEHVELDVVLSQYIYST